MSKWSIKQDLAAWICIDDETIAEYILDELENHGIEPTLANAQKVWLDVLENEIYYAIKSSIEAKF